MPTRPHHSHVSPARPSLPCVTPAQVESRVKGRFLVLDAKTRQLSLTQEGMLVLFR